MAPPASASRPWSLKHLHRLIVTSTAYRQTSRRNSVQDRVDPDNRLLARMNVRRLEAEAVRDGILVVSGRLNRTLFGPPVPVHLDEAGQCVLGAGTLDADGRPTAQAALHADEFRRSLYVQVRRSMTLGVLETFDAPIMEPNCELRTASTVPPQALLFMNSGFILKQSEEFARRVQQEAGTEQSRQVRHAWRLAFGVEPSTATVQRALPFLAEGPPQCALASFCQSLLASNQFLYVD
jgi:hypothetical protein